MWLVEYTDQFGAWFESLSEMEQEFVATRVEELIVHGPNLGRPAVDQVTTSRHGNLKELRAGRSLRALFAFDPRRTAVLLIGGDKSPDDPESPNWNAWYRRFVPIADDPYDNYLRELRSEGLI